MTDTECRRTLKLNETYTKNYFGAHTSAIKSYEKHKANQETVSLSSIGSEHMKNSKRRIKQK